MEARRTYRRSLLDVSEPESRTIARWSELARRVDAPPYLRPGWFVAWARAFGTGELELHSVWRGDTMTAALPLVRRPFGRSSPTNVHSEEYGPIGSDDTDVRELLAAVLERVHGMLMLSHVRAPLRERITSAARAADADVTSWTQHRSPAIRTDRPLGEYEAERDRRWLRQLDRRRRRLEEQGGLSLDVLDGEERLDAHLRECFELEASGWKGENATAILSHASTASFYRDVARWAASERVLRLAELRLDGRLIAFDLCLENGEAHYFLKTGYDESLRSEAPGMVLRRMMIERAFDGPWWRYELLGAAEGWKARWADHSSEVTRIAVTERNAAGRLARAGLSGARSARALLRRAAA